MTLEARFPLGAFNVLPHAFSDCCAGAAEGVSMGRRVRVSRPEPQSDSYLPGNEEHPNPRADLSDEQTAFEVLPEEGMAQQNEWGSWGGRLRGSAAPATARGTPGAPGTPTSSEPAPDRSSLPAPTPLGKFVGRDFRYEVGRYHTQFRLLVIATWPLILLAWLVQLPQRLEQQVIVLLEMLLILGVIIAAMWIWTIKPRRTSHRVDEEGIWLHQGYAIDLLLPWSAIQSIRHTDERGRKLGVFVRDSTLYVTGDRANRLIVQLDPHAEVRHRGKPFDQVIFDVLEPDLVIQTVASGLGTFRAIAVPL